MQIKETQIIRLANTMGMSIEDKQHQLAIHDAITNVSSIEDFVEYCRKNKDGIEYANRLDKLEHLFTRYKNTIDNIPTEKLEVICHDVATKFKNAISILRDKEEIFTDHLERLSADKVQYFTDNEIRLLNSVGKLNRLINLYELGSLYDALYSTSVKMVLIKNTNSQITDGEKRVKQLVKAIL